MGRLDFGRPAAPLVPHHLHIDDDAVDEGLYVDYQLSLRLG